MKKLLVLILLIAFVSPLFAFDFFATLDDEEGQVGTEPAKPKELTSLFVEGFGTYYPLDEDEPFDYGISLGVTFEENRERIRTEVDFSFSPILRDPLDVRTLAVTFFFGPTNLKVGMFTHPWGTSTTLHAVDILNSQNLTHGILDNPEAMKKSEFMIVYNAYFKRSSLDLIIKPFYRPIDMEASDRYAPMDTDNLMGTSFSYGGMEIPIDSDNIRVGIYEHPKFWKALGGGGRFRFGIGDLDLGFMYFSSFYPQMGFDIGAKLKMKPHPQDPNPQNPTQYIPDKVEVTSIDFDFTRYHFAGTEGSLLVGPVTIAWEGGLFLSEDIKGEKPEKYNTKAMAVVELSYTEPKTSFFASVAYQGQYLFGDVTPTVNQTLDVIIPVDYIASFLSDKPYSSSVAVAFEMPFMRERLKVRMAATYGIENQGLVALGSLSYEINDSFSVYARGAYYNGFGDKKSLFKNWENNSSVTIGMNAWF
jgi:hypothetical protein